LCRATQAEADQRIGSIVIVGFGTARPHETEMFVEGQRLRHQRTAGATAVMRRIDKQTFHSAIARDHANCTRSQRLP
jgi:hypothetical protein